jgi:hypothetical protein
MNRRLVTTLVGLAVVILLVAAIASLRPGSGGDEGAGPRAAQADRDTAEAEREGESAREQAEEAAEELRGALPVVHVAAAQAAPAPGWQAEQVWSATGNDWEPAIAAAPNSNWVYQATTRYGGPKACQQCSDPAILVRASSDGGASWGADRYICACKNVKAQNDPQLAVATDGTIYAAWLNDYNPGVVFSKSTDHGVTWSTPLSVKGKGLSFSDKPILAISPTGQDVYIAWNASDSYMSVSHNFGASFGARIKTNTDSRYWFAEGGVVAPNGNVYFGESAENQSATGTVQLSVIRSTNGGSSWTTTLIDTSQQQPPCTAGSTCPPDFFGPQIGVGVDSAGTLMVAYALNTTNQAPLDLFVRTSTSAGGTWSARTEIGQAPGTVGADFPVIEGVGANDFRVAWQDDRNGVTSWDTWYARTTNGGGSWTSPVRLSDAGGGAPYKNANGYSFPYGDYFDLDVTQGGTNVVIWGEGTDYVGPGGSWFTRGL